MSNFSCPRVTSAIQEIYAEVQRLYPEASIRYDLTAKDVAGWVDIYSRDKGILVDKITKKDAQAIVNHIEKCLNMDGKSFKHIPYTIEYTYQGKKRTYTILKEEGTSKYRIFNKDSKEVFTEDSKDRRKIFANLAVQQGRAVIVEHKGKKYVVSNRDQIISVQTGDEMKWGEENGDRKEILALSKAAFEAKQKAEIPTTTLKITPIQASDKKATIKGSISNKFIGFANGINGSSTAEYAKQAGDKANVGVYSPEDTVFVSIPGIRGNAEIRHKEQQKTIEEALKALRHGATLITDNESYTNNSSYNEGEKKLSKVLKESGAIYSERVVDGETLGVWVLPKQKAKTTTTNSNTALEGSENYVRQLIEHLKASGINVFDRAAMDKFFKEHPNTLIQQALEEQWEMQDIRAKAIADGRIVLKADGTFDYALASNDKKSNLNERQWLQVRTKNFINWFGDWINDPQNASKVVDKNGEPLVVYHNSKGHPLTSYDIGRVGENGGQMFGAGIYTSTNKKYNSVFGDIENALFINIKNPLKLSSRGNTPEGRDFMNAIAFDRFKEGRQTNVPNHFKEKYDGVIGTNLSENATIEYVAWNPNQIKSATDNNGMFSTENDDIQMSVNNKKALNSLDIIDETIKKGNWSDESIEELDNLNNEDYGKILKRFSQEELEGSDEILKQAETIVSRGSRGSDTSNSQGNRERAEQQIESWAKENRLWYNDYQESKDGSLESVIEADGGVFSNKSGSESLVYWMNDGTTVKAVDASHYEGDVQKLLDKVVLHNSLFPETAYSVLGFGRDRSGAFRIIIKQQIVKGTRPTTEEILSFIEKLGLEKKRGWYYTKDGKRLTDLNYGNIIKVSENTFAVIDCDVEFTPEYLNSIKDFPQLFTTPQGEIYGFVDKEGNMYLDETIVDASHPIHEYTHLWDRALAKINPRLWQKGIKLMQEGVPALWNEIANSENYGKLWQSKGIKEDRLVNLIASEVHARLVGDNGAKLLDEIAKEKGQEGIIAKLKQWIVDAWKELKKTFSNWSQEEIDKLTLKDFNHITVRDFADGINPNTVSPLSNAASNNLSSSASSNPFDAVLDESIGTAPSVEEVKAFENKPKAEKPNSEAYESALKTNDSRVAQFKRTFSPQQIKDRGAMISDIFSEIIDEHLWDLTDYYLDKIESDTATEQEKNDAREILHKLRDPLTGRQYAAQDKQISVILDEIKQRLQDALESAIQYNAGEKKVQLWQNTIDYFKDLFNTQATLDIEEREGIRIVGLEIKEQTASEEGNDAQNDGDDEVGHLVSGNDGWNFQVRYTNPFDSLSRKVRGMLYEIERPNSEKDDLGQTRYYPMGQIYASFLSYLAKNMQDSNTFVKVDHSNEGKDRWDNDITETSYPNGYPTFPVLEQMKTIYPWVQQIIDRLTDDYMSPEINSSLRYPPTGGAMASQFYTNFRKAYIPYGKIQIGINPKTGNPYDSVTPLNYQMEERVQRDKLEANYNNRMILTDHSIYNSDGTVNKENAEWLKVQSTALSQIVDRYIDYPEKIAVYENTPENAEITAEDINRYNRTINLIRKVLQSYGIDATQDSVVSYMMMDSGDSIKRILADLSTIADKVLKVDDSKIADFNYIIDIRDNYGTQIWEHFFDGRGLITDASYMQSFYDSASKKTKYSYSADNYLMKTFRGVCMGTKEQRQKYIDEHFGKFEWFKNQSTGEWRNKWLEFFYNYDGDPNQIPYRNIDNVTEYGKYGAVIRQYSKWTPDDIWQVQNRSYNPEAEHQKTAFYLAPIFSDSPMSMTVMGPKMTMDELLYGYDDNTLTHHRGALVNLVNQELWRIQYVQERAKAIEEGKIKAIANFDGSRGQQFCFLPELNKYTFPATDKYPKQSFLDRMISMKKDKKTAKEIEELQINAIRDVIDSKAGEFLTGNEKHYTSEHPFKVEQYYNMVYANAAIIQMTTVDLAFYKNDTDFQKRFKEVYAGGIQLNTNSKYGKKTENIILLSDDIITSPSYTNVAKIIDNSKTLSQKDKDDIKATFTDINVADAQAIRSMHSFRSILDMMGNWTDEMETALQHFKDKTWNKADFDIIYQTIKPFVYSVIERNDGSGGSILVPQQNKNSEICALMMYDLIANGLDASPVYKALSRFMEENLDADGNHLVDMAQFESAGKVGNQGVVNISFNPDKVIDLVSKSEIAEVGKDFVFYPATDKNGNFIPLVTENADKHYRAIKEQLDEELSKERITQKTYNSLMQSLRPTEEEIISMLEQAALVTNPDGTKSINPEVVHTIPFDNYYQQQPTPEHHIDAEATFGSQARNIAVADLPDDFEMSIKVKGGTHTFKGKDAIIDFYYELLNENLLEDFFGKNGLKSVFKSKESLRDAVTEIVRGNPKYGRDFAEALQLDDNGNFVLSPNSPTIFNLMQEIVTAFFKNRITKQTINGAALIQAAGIGLDKDLRMIFDKNGKLVGAECLMPLTSKRFFEPLLETKVIDGKEVKVLDPKKLKKAGLDKAIGYRIPTENKSSMMPLIIKDFTPLQNGSAIVLPAEITNIAGSDFDVDKMFIMLLSFYVREYDMKAAREIWARKNNVIKEISEIFYNSDLLDEVSEMDPEEFRKWFEENKEDFKRDEPIIRKIEYDFSKSPKENGRKARNNMLIQMIFGILTSKEGSEQLFNPQGFKDFKRAAKINRILTDHNLRMQFFGDAEGEALDNLIKSLLNTSTDKLEKFISDYSSPESPVYPQTFAHSHARNMAGANQIGIYAVQASMCAKYQRANTRLMQRQQFTLNNRIIANVDMSEGGKRLKNVGQPLGASADNGKDPNLTDAGSTTKTAPIIGYMLRAGMNQLEAVLVVNQPYMVGSGYNSKNWNYWSSILDRYPLDTPVEVTTDMLIKNLIKPDELTDTEYKAIAGLCYRVLMQHEAQEYLTQISRADSPNGAMQNSYAKARIQRYKVDLFNAKMGQRDFPFVRIKEALNNNAIDITASEEVIREQLKEQRMAFLHGMYSLGIDSFNSLVSPYFFGAEQWFDDRIVKPILYNLNEKLPDDTKEEIVNGIYLSYITYMLSGCSLFGNEQNSSMKQKRDYYLNTFPTDYLQIIRENEDIRELLGNVLQVKSSMGRMRVVLQDVGSLSKGQKQDVQNRFESLLYSKNKVARDLAKDLLIYSYFDNGLQFRHDSFSHLFTTGFITNFYAYTDTLNNLDKEITPEEEENFIHQFLLTYPNAAFNVNSILVGDVGYTITDSQITINNLFEGRMKYLINDVMSPNPLSEGVNVYPYIYYNGDVYVLDQNEFEQEPSKPVYNKLIPYQTYPKVPLFSREMSILKMAEQFPITDEQNQYGEMTDPSNIDSLMAHNEGGGNPDVDNDSLFSELESSGALDALNSSEIPQIEESGPSDTFHSEGEAELKDPFCLI